VLVIDDSVDTATTLADVLRFFGYEVEVAFGAAAGLRAAEEHHPDVILCDLRMPRMSGCELATALRRDPRLVKTRLIAVSGVADPRVLQAAADAGFDAHIVKPPDPGQLVNLVET
jgi:CheY-like chemotaxis protein